MDWKQNENSTQFQYARLNSATSSMQLYTDNRETFYNKLSINRVVYAFFDICETEG